MIATVLASVAAAVVIPRLDRPDPLFEPESFSLGVPDGWRRCWNTSELFSIALPTDWSWSNDSTVDECKFADPRPFEVPTKGRTPATALRVMSGRYDVGEGARRAFRPYNYPDTLKALVDDSRWNVRTNRRVRVDGLPTRLIESVAKEGGYYERGTVLYVYLVAADARLDRRCARFFVHCRPFLVSTRVDPNDVADLPERKTLVDEAARSLEFFNLSAGTERRNFLALECFFDAYMTTTVDEATECTTPAFRMSLRAPVRREPVVRFTTMLTYHSKPRYRRMVVRTYRGAGEIDRYSDDVFTMRADRPESFLGLGPDPGWRVTDWESGPEIAFDEQYPLKIYLPARDACDVGMYHPGGLDESFNPKALVVVTRPVPADDVLSSHALRELAMGASRAERASQPRAGDLYPEGLRAHGGTEADGRGAVGWVDDDLDLTPEEHAAGARSPYEACTARLNDLAASKTMRAVPGVKKVEFSFGIVN